MAGKNESCSSFPIGKTPQEMGMSYVPKCYMLPSSQRPSLNPEVATVPVVDFAGLNDDSKRRSKIIQDIAKACRHNGLFQVSSVVKMT